MIKLWVQNRVSTECPSLTKLTKQMSMLNKDTDFSIRDLIEVDFFEDYLALEPTTLEHRTSVLLF